MHLLRLKRSLSLDNRKRVAISVGDLNGIGLELAFRNHLKISNFVDPIYMIDREMTSQGAKLLDLKIPKDFKTVENIGDFFKISPAETSSKSGKYSYNSFMKGIEFVKDGSADSIITLPINKEAWNLAGIDYKGHTDALRDIFKRDAIMLMGTPKMYVALFTEHIPYSKVPENLTKEKLYNFLKNLYQVIPNIEKIGVLGLNPHSGDNGVLGDEERIIEKAVDKINMEIGRELFSQPLVPDIAFTPYMREIYKFYVAIYHDQGLIPLKTLYFNEAINISLNIPIVRVSVGHGTAFDRAYKKDVKLNSESYINAVKLARDWKI